MKRLKTLQTISKICKILSKIAFIFCIIGAAGCTLGLMVLAIGGGGLAESIKSVAGRFADDFGSFDLWSAYAALITGALVCGSQIFLTAKAVSYFDRELADGTPFTFRGAKEIRLLGILNIAVSLGTSIVCAIMIGIVGLVSSETGSVDISVSSTVGLGIFYLVLSFVFEHGAELSDQLNKPDRSQEYYGEYNGELK